MTSVGREVSVDRAGVRLAAIELGDPQRPGLLLTHGVASSLEFLQEAFTGPFLDTGWRVVLMALPGHEPSSPAVDPARFALSEVASDLSAVALTTRSRVVGGVSLGAHAAVLASVMVAADAVVACLPAWMGRAAPGDGPHAVIADEVRRVGIPELIMRMETETAMLPWLRATLVRDWRRHDPASLAAALVSLDGGLAPTAGDLQALGRPLAVVSWPDDPGHPLEAGRAWADLAPTAAFEQISMEAVGADRSAFGRSVITALGRLDVDPRPPD